MRRCYNSTSEVAHIWAHQLQDSARYSGGNFYFHGNTIYSYGSHFPCGKIVQNQQGKEAYILNSDSYSTTTAKHKNEVWQAIPSSSTYFSTPGCKAPELSRSGKYLYGYWQTMSVIVEWLSDLESFIDKQKKARSRDYRGDISRIVLDIHDWIEFWGLHKKSKWAVFSCSEDKLENHVDIFTFFGKQNSYAEIHHYCQKTVDRCVILTNLFNALCTSQCLLIGKNVIEYTDVDRFLELYWGTDIAKELEAKQKKVEVLERQRQRKIAKQRIKEDHKRLEQWHEHDPKVYNWHPSHEFIAAYQWHTALRITKDYIATSKHITISFEEGKRLWLIIKALHNGMTFKRDVALSLNGQKWVLNSYENDILTAGCHKIPFSECERIANIMGW